jgi:hypothetical protein
MRVAFELDGTGYEAELLKRGTKNARIAWPERDVPPQLAARAEAGATRTGWLTMLVPIAGAGAVTLCVLPKPPPPARPGRRSLGVQTAELAKAIAQFVREQGWSDRIMVICSHRGLYQGEREEELIAAGIVLRQIAFFIGEDHTSDTKAGVSDIAIVTRADPKRTILLIEIEEAATGAKPKAVIGDGLLPVLADRVDVRKEDNDHFSVSLEGSAIWVGYHPRPGYDVSRTERLEGKLNGLLKRARRDRADGPMSLRLFNQPPATLYRTLLEAAQQLLIGQAGMDEL